ncbi:hypothetical protein KC19_4G259000 [Ceratodon purpureus]|uniref:Glycosyltransferase family 92 protein n=1 Tax=Ceratodon purpureus TaxID=3225 RepID=A0A8T0IF56_CERPU|nr:hypothetical protein KC19_4G259000 [Ceratodon purpureus]
MAKIENEHAVVKVEKEIEPLLNVREKACRSKVDLGGFHIKFQIKNILCTMVLAMGFFLVAAQLLPLIGYDAKFWCSVETGARLESLEDAKPHHQNLLAEASLHEKLDTSSIDLSHGEVRGFKPHGLATHLYIEMSAYRGGPRVFSIVGLTSKSIETHHKPPYACEWVSSSSGQVVKGRARKLKPDWNYGKLYTVVVNTCSFAEDVGVDREGGELILYASYGDQYRQPERIVVLTESKGEYNASIFDPQNFPYDYVYCGSSVYGDISPQRMREWMAYHAKFFGEKSHFILHDSGGFHDDVRKVLEPWIKKGRVTLQNIRQQEVYDGYYHNQFLVVNDCLFRSRFMANWTFFFDIDEYMYVDRSTNLSAVLNRNPNATQIIIQQVPIATGMCVAENTTLAAGHERKWGFEKLIYQKPFIRGVHHDRKYALQARHAAATGIHMSINMRKGRHTSPRGIRYYHYHGTINKRDDVCSIYVDPRNQTALRSHGVRLDKTMANMAKDVKSYERKIIGKLPFIL